jgi:hypothetical protein
MQIDLGADYPITKIVVYNRVDCCQNKINGAFVSVIDSNVNPTFISEPINFNNGIGNSAYVIQPPKKEITYFANQNLTVEPLIKYNWVCAPGFDAPVSLNESGDVQCMSADAHGCIPGGCAVNLQNPPVPVKPLVCGEMHNSIYGFPGYENPTHWCNTVQPAVKGTIKKWGKCVASDECAGADDYCRVGDPRCLSDADCTQANTIDKTNRDCTRLPKKTATVVPTVGPARVYKILAKTNYAAQGDIKDLDGDINTCKSVCDQTQNCKGFTIQNNKHCWLKDDTVKTPSFVNDMAYYYTGEAPSAAGVAPVGTGRYVKIEQPVVGPMNLAEVQVFSTDGQTNIALNKKVTQSSVYDERQFPPSNLVDGNPNNFAHTTGQDQPWVQIDLGNDYPITKVVVYNRVDCCQDRINGAVIGIIDSNMNTTYVSEAIDIKNPIGNMAYVVQPPNKAVAYFDNQSLTVKPTIKYDWKCVAGIDTPVGFDASDKVQCMSLNATDCLWGGCEDKVANPPANLKPLVCTGNEAADHWCNTAKKELNKQRWVCVPGIESPVNLSATGEVECMSADGRGCIPGDCQTNLKTPPDPIQPLICGLMHRQIYGRTGYDIPGHWCNTAKPYLGL